MSQAPNPPLPTFEPPPELARGEVPTATDPDGKRLGTTPETPDPVRPSDAPPDPIASSPLARAEKIYIPDGLDIEPSWEVHGANDRDDQTRGWDSSHLTAMSTVLPEPYTDELGQGSKTIELSVLHIGCHGDVRDSMVVTPGEIGPFTMRVVDVAGHPAVLMPPKDSGTPPPGYCPHTVPRHDR